MAKMERQVHFRQGKQAEGNRETGWLRIPGKWLQKMRVDPEHPDVTLFFDGEKITIEQTAKSGIRKSPLAGKARLHRFARVWLALISGHRSNPQVERFFAGRIFGDTCFALGFDMDGGQSLARAVPGEPHLFSDSRIFASCVDRLDIQTLGNAIFSRWRQWTHWDECSLDEDGWAWFVTALEHLAQLTGEEDGTPCGEKEEE